ncbi:MAG: diaminopimelate epimerase [Thermotogaceae bacterium]|jgi:diaminopimelate epimerase|nr:diaminopimelate epimerase [Thermotogaceae bacterium]MDN5338141.1 diaminopimelate epimerase [Thermotogaceae bacterium]
MLRYSANGNSFVVFNLLEKSLSDEEKEKLVLENVGDEDGVLFVERKNHLFSMDYFNRDGKRAKFCGNGSRAFLKYLFDEGYIKEGKVDFWSYAGLLRGIVKNDKVSVAMPEITLFQKTSFDNYEGHLVVVGVPHFVVQVENVEEFDVEKIGRYLRQLSDANVNFFEEVSRGYLKIRTYERGVERETKACGSGATATFAVYREKTGVSEAILQAPGGQLRLYLSDGKIFLEGSVERCSEG